MLAGSALNGTTINGSNVFNKTDTISVKKGGIGASGEIQTLAPKLDKIVKEKLGHSSIAIILDTYTHVAHVATGLQEAALEDLKS